MPLDINGKQYLSAAEAARQLGVTPGRVRQLIMDGIITDVVKLANRSFLNADQVDAYAQRRGDKH